MRPRAQAVWQSDALGALTVAPAELGADVAADLGVPHEQVSELVSLYVVALDVSLAEGLPRLLADQLAWQRVRLRTVAPRVEVGHVVAAVRRRLGGMLSAGELAEVDSQVERATDLAAAEPAAAPVAALGPVASAYLERVLAGDRRAAIAVVTAAVDNGMSVRELLLEVLEPVQVELGLLWERGLLSVAQEHFGTAVTQLAMAMLYPRLFDAGSGASDGPRMVAVSAGPEAHEVGLRIVTDLLESAGWRTTYLGSAVPVDDMVEELVAARADVLAVSASMAGHVRHVRQLVDAVRSDPRTRHVRVVAGGRAFRLAPELAAAVGADAWAAGGMDAVEVCNRMLEVDRAVG